MSESVDQEIRTLQALCWSSRDPEGLAFAPLAEALSKRGDIRQAVDLLSDGISRHPNFSTGHVIAAGVYLGQGMMAEADSAARRTLELDPENVVALAILSQILGERGAEETKSVDDKLVVTDPEVVKTSIVSDRLEGQDGQVVEGRAELPDPAEEDPHTYLYEPVHTRTLAALYMSQGFSTKALDVYRHLRLTQPNAEDLAVRITELEGIVCATAQDSTRSNTSEVSLTKVTDVSNDAETDHLKNSALDAACVLEGGIETLARDLSEGDEIGERAVRTFSASEGSSAEGAAGHGVVEPKKIGQYFDKLLGWEADKE